jgi:ABC-type Zn uptake system ZnuABC Zn-binding protein ZnuA
VIFRSILAVTAGTLLVSSHAFAQDAMSERPPLVLTATQATYSVASALTAGTPVVVVNIPDDGREFAVLKPYIERRKDRLATLFASATAVVSVTNALPADPLYRYARAANVRIVDIDAALPWTYDTPGVALIDAPISDVHWAQPTTQASPAVGTSPWFWLSISNTIRMADITASDLNALFPALATTVSANLARFKRALLEVRGNYQDRLLAAADDTVFALTGDFVYLTNDLGLFVDGYFIKQDVNWTQDDLIALTAHLEERDIRVVIHKWEPSDAIQAAIHAAGAQLVVLETGDQGRIVDDALATDGLQQILIANLDKITTALSE